MDRGNSTSALVEGTTENPSGSAPVTGPGGLRTANSPAARCEALPELLAREGELMRWNARRLSLCADDADDAFQRAVEIFLTKGPPLDGADLGRWMQTVVRNEALRVRRQRERMLGTYVAEDGRQTYSPEALPTDLLGPAERLEAQEQVSRGSEALGGLKPDESRALALTGGGYSYAEIGEMTGWSLRRVNRLMANGRQRLRDAMTSIESGERCEQLRDVLLAAGEGAASPAGGVALRRHLLACGPCRAELRAHRGGVPALSFVVPGLAGAHAWLARLHDSAATAIGDRAAHATWRLQQVGEAATAQKAAVAVAVTAAATGSGAAMVTKVERDAGSPRAAITQAAAVTAPAAIPASPPVPPVPPAAAVGPTQTPEEAAKVARERKEKARAAARLKAARRVPAAEFGPDGAGQAVGGIPTGSTDSASRSGARSASAGRTASPSEPSDLSSGPSAETPTSPAPPPPSGSGGGLPQGGSDEFGP